MQEALTNSLKHAGPTHVSVTLDYEPEYLGVEVHDRGGPGQPNTPSAGFGLIGMRQRAAMLGGVLVVGPDADRGFRVSARLPVDRGDA